ncbi:hypothetical protein ACFOGI_11220 [Virgibacillus xinjiangensis]|uniref:Uncharacterized protein n=1 Tax=Virgibacillus xinjiangensis TaxID=393090 RepID=A0ABV7CXI4_9BACI
MSKKGLAILFVIIILLTGGLITAGEMITSKEEAKPAFTGEFSIGENNRLVYVMEEGDAQHLYVQSENGESQHVYESEGNLEIRSPLFTGENTIAFISTTGAPEGSPGEQEFQLVHSDVISVQIESGEEKTLLEARGLMTGLVYDDANSRIIANGVHISTDKEPEEGFIPYASGLYTLSMEGEFEEIRTIDTYSPGSLQITEDGKKLLMILPDDFEDATPESMFEATERIFEMEIEKPSEMEVVSKEGSDIPISEFVLFKNGTTLLYQTIMNWGDGGNYLYDHVWFDRSKQEEGERLHINEPVLHSMLNDEETWLYYVRSSRKSNQDEQYDLYRFDLKGDRKEEQVNLGQQGSPSEDS